MLNINMGERAGTRRTGAKGVRRLTVVPDYERY